MDFKILEDQLQVTIERGNLSNRHDQILHKRIIVDLGLLKSGKVELRRTVDQGNLRKLLGIQCKNLTLIVRNLFSAEICIPARYGELIQDRTLKPVSVHHQEQAYFEKFIMGSEAAEKSKTKCQTDRMSNVAESGVEHSIIWGMFIATTLHAATFMGKNFSTIQSFVWNSGDLTLKQMFDVTAPLVNNQDEIHGLTIVIGERILGHVSH